MRTYTINEVLEGVGAILPNITPKNGHPPPVLMSGTDEVTRARAYLARIPPAIAGEGGNAHSFRVAAILVVDFVLSDSDALDLLREWNQTNAPPWTDDELQEFIDHARKYGKKAPGAKLRESWRNGHLAPLPAAPPEGHRGSEEDITAPKVAEDDQEQGEEDPPEHPNNAPDLLQDLNRKLFVIEESGKHFVACEWFDPVRKRRVIKRYTFEEFKKHYMGQTITLAGSVKSYPLAKTWLEWGGRRQYLGGVVFDPTSSAPPDVYNLWRGWPIPPRPGNWTIIREHIFEILCARHEDQDAWFMGWLRRLVQHPERPGEVVPVFRGPQGAGKTLLTNGIRRMLGQHAMAVSSPRAVIGQFNAHLRDLVFLLMNEALFAGDRAIVSALKSLITDETLFIEQKGIDPVEVPNFLHIAMTTNADWCVPVALDDRRFAVFDVSSARVGDRAYFRELAAAVENDDAIGAMLHDLLTSPIDGFEVRNIPHTKARREQMVHSLEGEAAWLFHVLALGNLGLASVCGWQPWASTKILQDSHEIWARTGTHRRATDPATLGKFLARFYNATRPRADNPGRDRGYFLGPLEKARSVFLDKTGLTADVFPPEGDEDQDQWDHP